VSLRSVGVLPVCAAAVVLPIARVWLALAPGAALRWTSVTGRPSSAISQTFEVSLVPVDRLCRAIAGVGARWPFRSTCLEQGIALVMLLALARKPARVVIGVARRDGDIVTPRLLHAHAWVESEGRILLGAAHSQGLLPLT
jgi:Transglutaminase-like superfamily